MKWRLFICSDCDTDAGVAIMQVPDGAHPDRSSGIELCPGCGSQFSMCNMGEVEVSGDSLIHLQLREPAEVEK